MASEIAGQPHWEVGFDEHGKADQAGADALLAELPGKDLTDLFVFAHGWNNDWAIPSGEQVYWSGAAFAGTMPPFALEALYNETFRPKAAFDG